VACRHGDRHGTTEQWVLSESWWGSDLAFLLRGDRVHRGAGWASGKGLTRKDYTLNKKERGLKGPSTP